MPPKPSSSSTSAATSRNTFKLSANAEKLYKTCLSASQTSSSSNPKIDFTAEELISYDVVGDNQRLLELCHELHEAMLVVYVQADASSGSTSSGTKLSYRIRTPDAAEKLRVLDENSLKVYDNIEAAGTTGIWTKHLRVKTQIHQASLTTALKKLEGRMLVKQTRNVSFPGRKLYMLSYLEPTNEATGGPWYSEGEPDVALIDTVKNLVVLQIQKMSWRTGPKRVFVEDERNPKVKRIADLSELELRFGPPAFHEATGSHMLLPHPSGYEEYPTASGILAWINEKDVIKGKEVKAQDVQQLLTVLTWEGRIEPMGKKRRPLSDFGSPPASSIEGDQDPDQGLDQQAEEDETMYRSVRKPYVPHSNHTLSASSAAAGTAGGQAQQQQQQEQQAQQQHHPPSSMNLSNMITGGVNAFADTPCARCPVFRLCEDGGPVDAKNCGYFAKWLLAF